MEKHKVRYLIVGGLAFIFHAKPRYTKDIDIWVDSDPENMENVNKALSEFGSPYLISLPVNIKEILQLGIAPNRIDILFNIQGLSFDKVWGEKIRSTYGEVMANWIDIDSLILAKQSIDSPRHKEDVRVLLKVKELQTK
ncbi:MAG: hypothetical protein JRI53_11680 [Deltaproteobacteria bacterium]|nr:hypothetical protein [Deltaproteobacteria bacterium]